MVADTERGEDPDQRDEHAGRAERREPGQRGGGQDVEGAEEGVRGQGPRGGEEEFGAVKDPCTPCEEKACEGFSLGILTVVRA